MKLNVKTSNGSYDVISERGILQHVAEIWNIRGKCLVVTDSGVPKEYAQTVAAAFPGAAIFTFEQGEKSKNINTLQKIWAELARLQFTRQDAVIAVGGGVVGDMAGFAAATYLRGIDFYNIPTTVLSQVDSSVGGKTAIDFGGYKNNIGAFWPPKGVLIDSEVLSTLPARQVSAGLIEAMKMGATNDRELFELFEGDISAQTDRILARAVEVKANVVEQDEREGGLRRVLNFGHTVGHAIESTEACGELFHGECVGLGMLPMCAPAVRARIKAILHKLQAPEVITCDAAVLTDAMAHDKKRNDAGVTAVVVDEIGTFRFEQMTLDELEKRVTEAAK